MTDRLARIEREALSVGSFQRKMSRAPGVMADDVLALVEIAKAARLMEAHGCENYTSDERPVTQWGCLKNGRTADARYGADRSCYPCQAHAALSVLDDREET